MSAPRALPLLPGTNFDLPSSRSSHRKTQVLTYSNSVPIVSADKLTPRSPSASIFPTTSGAGQQPAWIAFDRQVLRFEAYYQEAVVESRLEQSRQRRVHILYYLEDDTIQINEQHQENSGIPQGTLLKRHRIPKPAPNDEEFFTVADLNVGVEITLYGKTFRIIKCDKFTNEFLNKLGVRVGQPEDYPEDSYTQLRQGMKQSMVPNRPYEKFDTRRKFLDHDRHVLRFYGFWDDSDSMFGDRRKFVLHYYLADDTIEILEVLPPNCGRDAPSIFLKRQKLPKVTPSALLPGVKTDRTILNVFGGSISANRVLLDSLKTGAPQSEFYQDNELQIGSSVNVFGRQLVLCDCDDFTKAYYSAKYGVEDFTPISVVEPVVEPAKREIPPHNGIGSEEDSLVNVLSLIPKPPKKDLSKFYNKETHAVESEKLRFVARLDTAKPIDLDRRFYIVYDIVKDTVSVFEQQQRNSGIWAGKFLQEGKYKVPDGTRYFIERDFFLGARIEILKHKFVLIDADEYAFNYMEKKDVSFLSFVLLTSIH